MRIGLQVPDFTWPGGAPQMRDTLRKITRTAEDAGFASLWVMDHFMQIPSVHPPEHPILEAWTTLGFFAALTQRVKLGTMVSGVTYRNPGVLAKIATTIDVLSGGRAYLGIGAAWYEREHLGLGIPFPPPKERLERLEEAVRIVKRLWSGEGGSYEGKHYQLAELLHSPQPVSKPHPAILIGGGGEQKTLRLVARYADASNIIFRELPTLKHKYEVLRHWCEVEGRPYDAIERTVLAKVRLGNLPDAESPGEVIERCHALAEAGAQHVIFNMPNVSEITPLEIFGRQIIPASAAF